MWTCGKEANGQESNEGEDKIKRNIEEQGEAYGRQWSTQSAGREKYVWEIAGKHFHSCGILNQKGNSSAWKVSSGSIKASQPKKIVKCLCSLGGTNPQLSRWVTNKKHANESGRKGPKPLYFLYMSIICLSQPDSRIDPKMTYLTNTLKKTWHQSIDWASRP